MDEFEKIGKEIMRKHVDVIPYTEVLRCGIQELESTEPSEIVSFGYPFLDEKLTGLFPGELVVVGGESGSGKTTFATNITYRESKKRKCLVFALEDRLHDYGIKSLYFEIGRIRKAQGKKNYPWNSYRRNEIKDADYLATREQAFNKLANDNLLFATAEAQMDIEMLEKTIEEHTQNGVKLFLIDHLHYFDLLKGDSSKADYIEQIMVRLKTLQNRTGARVILVVHYKKLNGQKPTLDSFKDSMAIVHNANYVINLWRDRTLQDDNDFKYQTKFMVPKSRNPNGEFTFDTEFDPETNDYKDVGFSRGTPNDNIEPDEIDF